MRIIIVGAGEVGFQIALRLSFEHKEVVVIDKNPEALRRVSEHCDAQIIVGSGCSPAILKDAGIEYSDILLAVTNSDESNLLACSFTNALNPQITKLVRVRSKEFTSYSKNILEELTVFGINKVINPDEEIIESITRILESPGALSIKEFVDGKMSVVGLHLPENSPINGLSIAELREKIGISFIMAAIIRNHKRIIPKGTDFIQSKDTVYFACEKKNIKNILNFFGVAEPPAQNILIVGGGAIGSKLAEKLEKKNYHVRLLEQSKTRCLELADTLNKTIVLHGDGRDQDLLREENIAGIDMIISVTGDDETNILSCLLGKNLGAKMTITRINNFGYMPIIHSIGIDHLVSPRLSAINSLLQYVRRGKVVASTTLGTEDVEVLEAIAQEKSSITGRLIKDIHFPSDILILCFKRGKEIIIPTGATRIEANDHLLILCTKSTINDVESALDVKMEFF